jgi:hypothetical protein
VDLKKPLAFFEDIPQLNQIVEVLLTTNMFIGGFLACFLDNTIPGKVQPIVFQTLFSSFPLSQAA